MTDLPDRPTRQLDFLLEIDALKKVLRMTRITGEERRENSAEHSWHFALAAAVLAEHADDAVDVGRVIRMALVHDLVEIDAGDTFAFDPEANLDKSARERVAAERLFGLLPDDQAADFRALWEEFEAMETADALFANAIDRLSAVLQNHANDGGTWRTHEVPREAILERQDPIRRAAPALWPWVVEVIDAST